MLEDFRVMRVIFPFDFLSFYCANLISPPPPLLAEILNMRTGAYSRKCGIQICRLAVSGSWDYHVCELVLPRSHFGGIFWPIIFLYHSHFWIPLIMRIFVVNLQLHLSPQ